MAARDASMTVPSWRALAPPVARAAAQAASTDSAQAHPPSVGVKPVFDRWNPPRAHGEAALEACLAASDGRRQRVCRTLTTDDERWRATTPHLLHRPALAIMMSRCMR